MFDYKTLKSLLETNGLTQQRLAEITGISKQAISEYVNGNMQPSSDRLKLIADALGVPVDKFCSEVCPKQDALLLTVSEAAKMMGVSNNSIKEGIIHNEWNPPIGSAIRGRKENYKYHIPKRRVELYMGVI